MSVSEGLLVLVPSRRKGCFRSATALTRRCRMGRSAAEPDITHPIISDADDPRGCPGRRL